MQPPIPVGTVLQNRYRLIDILGQGGMGRTYLAEDQGRFHERCALKELIPAQTEAYVLQKSKELFAREANILYQIQHPQIPQFRATFEQDGRFFLVQDYVEGKTYRELLGDRLAQGKTFSEAEIRPFLLQLLPVLEHIHSKGIIHRDISPENIIWRQSDSLPVLIDFGVVKELATRFRSPDTTAPPTTVGKLGYAPSEQIQSGRAYPSSDLYALAVTAIVLLTGKEPRELFDDTQLSWNWRRWTQVSDNLASVLDRMLSYRPGDRYQSAKDILPALQAPPLTQPANSNVSRMQTVAVGRNPEPLTQRPNRPDPVIPPVKEDSIWDKPGAIVGLGILLALLAGFGSWALVSAVLSSRSPDPSVSPTVAFTPTTSPTPSETPTPTPSPTPQPSSYSQKLFLAPGTPLSVKGNLKPNTTLNYTLQGEQGQKLSAAISSDGVLMTVLGPDGNPIGDRSFQITSWTGTLPFSGNYTLQLKPQGSEESNYSLNVNLTNAPSPSPSPSPSSSPSPSVSPSPQYNTEQLDITPDQPPVEVSTRTSPTRIKRYLVNVSEGQVLSVQPNNGAVTLDIRYPNGQLVEDAESVAQWEAQVPRSGNYQIDVIATEPTDFTLGVSVRNQ